MKIYSPRHPAKQANNIWLWSPYLELMSLKTKLEAIGVNPDFVSSDLMFETSGQERMRISVDGNLGIGHTNGYTPFIDHRDDATFKAIAQEMQELAEDFDQYFPEDT